MFKMAENTTENVSTGQNSDFQECFNDHYSRTCREISRILMEDTDKGAFDCAVYNAKVWVVWQHFQS